MWQKRRHLPHCWWQPCLQTRNNGQIAIPFAYRLVRAAEGRDLQAGLSLILCGLSQVRMGRSVWKGRTAATRQHETGQEEQNDLERVLGISSWVSFCVAVVVRTRDVVKRVEESWSWSWC